MDFAQWIYGFVDPVRNPEYSRFTVLCIRQTLMELVKWRKYLSEDAVFFLEIVFVNGKTCFSFRP